MQSNEKKLIEIFNDVEIIYTQSLTTKSIKKK